MNTKMIGLIALAVVAVGLLAWSFKSSFGGPKVVGRDEGLRMGEAMKKQYEQMEASGVRTPGGPGGAVPGGGAPAAPGKPAGQ